MVTEQQVRRLMSLIGKGMALSTASLKVGNRVFESRRHGKSIASKSLGKRPSHNAAP